MALLRYHPPNFFSHSIPNIPLIPKRLPVPSGLRFLRPRCLAEADDNLVSGMVKELLSREENSALLGGLEEASRRVDQARAALADIERQEAETRQAKEAARQIQNRLSEIEESEKELLEARAMVEEAQRTLSLNMDKGSSGEALNQGIAKEVERWESIKAALVSATIGTLAGLPILSYQSSGSGQMILNSIIIFISCALFGVTFRYTIRRDIDDVHLKTGTAAAFGFVKGLATLSAAGGTLEPNVGSFISLSRDGAVYVAEDFFIFLSAAVALDFCFKMRLLSPFPIRN